MRSNMNIHIQNQILSPSNLDYLKILHFWTEFKLKHRIFRINLNRAYVYGLVFAHSIIKREFGWWMRIKIEMRTNSPRMEIEHYFKKNEPQLSFQISWCVLIFSGKHNLKLRFRLKITTWNCILNWNHNLYFCPIL